MRRWIVAGVVTALYYLLIAFVALDPLWFASVDSFGRFMAVLGWLVVMFFTGGLRHD
jgi:hypothetical protein